MIISSLIGGVGNQLFEYAAGQSLAFKHNTQLKLDTYSLDQSFRSYCLDNFNISAKKATTIDILRLDKIEGMSRIFGPHACSVINRLAGNSKLLNFKSRYYDDYDLDTPRPPLLINRIASQRIFDYDKDYCDLPNDVILIGTWISYKYFEHMRPILLNEISVKRALSGKNLEVSRQIKNTQSISLHVRRTDKVNDPEYYVTDINYLNESIAYFCDLIADAVFYLFSDDIPWCKANIKKSSVVFVDWNDDACEDLRLMSLCKHNIIAESSFSWWGAYLNQNPNKLVVTPSASRWIKKTNFLCKDILPPEWKVLE